jgi:acetoin utilization deacetylase AcuC-like enzyme
MNDILTCHSESYINLLQATSQCNIHSIPSHSNESKGESLEIDKTSHDPILDFLLNASTISDMKMFDNTSYDYNDIRNYDIYLNKDSGNAAMQSVNTAVTLCHHICTGKTYYYYCYYYHAYIIVCI